MFRHVTLASCVCAAVVIAACGSPAPSVLVEFRGDVGESRDLVDLVKRAPMAEVIRETTAVEVGSPGSDAALISGWDRPEPHGETGQMAWAVAETAVVELLLLEADYDRLDLHGRAFSWEGGPDQKATVAINGRRIGELTIAPSMSDHSIAVPAGVLGVGTNRIVLEFAWTARPVDHVPGSTDRRSLAAAFQRLALANHARSGPERPRPEAPVVGDDELTLPRGAGLRYRFSAPQSGFLEFVLRSASTVGGPSGLKIWLASPDHPAAAVAEIVPTATSAEPTRLAIDWPVGETVELALAAVGGDAPGTGVVVAGPKVRGLSGGEEPMANLLLIVVDTLRADYLGVYGGQVDTPVVDGLAAEGVLFARARSHIPITGPSHASLFTSLLPMEHGVLNNAQELSESFPIFAEAVRASGRQTAAVISLGVMQRQFGFDRGFDHYGDDFPRDWMKNAAEVTDEALAVADGGLASPYLLWTHYSDPHEPYAPANLEYARVELRLDGRPVGEIDVGGRGNRFALDLPAGASELEFVPLDPEPGRAYRFDTLMLDDPSVEVEPLGGWVMREKRIGAATYQSTLPATLRLTNPTDRPVTSELLLTCKELLEIPEIRRRYAQEVEYVDGEIGRLLAGLEERGMMDDTLIVFLSDHGEGLGNHNHTGHVSQLYDTLVHVPMIFVWPGRLPQGMVIDDHVSLVDVFPTIAELMELEGPGNPSGVSLMPLIRGEDVPSRATLLATYPPESASSKRAIVADGYKFIHSWNAKREWVELYDVVNDPEELDDLATKQPEVVERLRSELQQRLSAISEGSTVEAELSEEDKAQLRALGYLH
ncbi:MAG: sulfatase [Candidatus Sulfomarinibacteraceae bacterium]